MFNVITQNRNDAQYLTRIIADSEADLPKSPEYSPGSTAIVADTGDEYMLNNQRKWFKYIKNTSGSSDSGSSSSNPIMTPMGTVASIDDLPTTGNRVWDIYMVGPQDDGSYDEYYWTANGAWDLMGKSIPSLDDVIKEQVLYSGNDKSGTVEIPADGTILKSIYDRMNSISFKRLDENNNESNFVDEVSVLINDQVIGKFFSPVQILNAKNTFVAEELVSFFTDLNTTPATYDESDWTAAVIPISDMTAENGPYLVLMTANPEQYHVKNLHTIFTNTMSREIMTIADIQRLAESVDQIIQDIDDIKDTLNTLEESSTLEII